MKEIFNKEITEEERNTVIVIASTNTAPSPTGLTNEEDLPGARQRAVLSPTTWLAFFDALLVALSLSEVKKTTYFSKDYQENLSIHLTLYI